MKKYVPLPLRDALRLDTEAGSRFAIQGCLGDRTLVRHNPVVRRVRRAVRERGFSFSSAPPYPYVMLPLATLHDIFSSRVIPFLETTAAARYAEGRNAGAFSTDELVNLGMRGNAVTHESAHCLCDGLLADAGWPRSPEAIGARGVRTRQAAVFASALGEACANATEILAAYHAETAAHQALVRINSYMECSAPMRRALSVLIQHGGEPLAFRAIAAGYLAANFLWVSADDPHVDALMDAAGCTMTSLKVRLSARRVVRDGLRLSVPFRLRTGTLFHKASGVNKNIVELMDFDFTSLLGNAAEPGGVLHRYADIVAPQARHPTRG